MYWDPITDKRQAEVGDGEEGLQIHASPDGKWALSGDKVLSLDDAKAIGTYAGAFCGWE